MSSVSTKRNKRNKAVDLESAFKSEEQALKTVNAYICGHNGDPNSIKDKKSGDTFLHLAARYNYKSVAVLVLEQAIDALATNKDGNIALEIAINKKRDDMSALIARNMKPAELRGVFGSSKPGEEIEIPKVLQLNKTLIESDCDFTETILVVFDCLISEKCDGSIEYDIKPIEEDTKRKLSDEDDFNYKDDTGFYHLAKKGNKEAINHRFMKFLINFKWKKWAKKKFLLNFALYLVTLFSLTYSVAVAGTSSDVTAYDTKLQQSRPLFEIIAYILILKEIISEICQIVLNGREYFKQLLNWLELLSVILLLLVLPVRYINVRAHWYIFALGYLLWVIKIFKYAAIFSTTGAYAESLRAIILRNFVPFSLLFCIVDLAFVGTFLLVLKGDGDLDTHDETSSFWEIWFVGLRTVIEAQPIVEYTGEEGYRPLGRVVMLLFMTMTIVVLLNILIAQLTETYHVIQSDARKSALVNKAWIIARLEKNASPVFPDFAERLKNSLPECLKPYLGAEKNRKIGRFLTSTYIETLHDISTPKEQIKSEIAAVQNKLIKTDLKVQTAKTRLRMLEEKLDKKLGDIQETLQSLKQN